MSKLSFRARQVDYTKPLPIYLNHDLPDLQDFAAINRSVPLMPTGMEKDEEAEHHLQRALSALQAFGATSSNEYAIPTPKVEIDNKMYERIYNIECPKQKTYIRIQPFSNDYDYPDYDADYEDENWLNEKKKTLPKEFNQDLLLYFETIMDRLEKVTSHSNILMSREEAKLLLMKEANNDDALDMYSTNTFSISNAIIKQQQKYKAELEEFLLSIYEYWKTKRLNCNHPLTPIVLTDKSGVQTQPNNPYLVFRRRTEKMQTRKNRKNEEQSYEKMLILKRDLCRAQHILKLIKKRENFKKEFLKLTLETFEKRYKLNDYDGSLTDSIACSLKPLLNNNITSSTINSVSQLQQQIQQQQTQPNTLNNLLNNSNSFTNNKLNSYNSQSNDKNLSSIDKTIKDLISSNKLKQLGSPPHSLKKLPHLEKDFLVDSIYKTSNLTNINSKLNRQLSEKQQKRLKKEKQQQQTSSGANQNTISNLINNSANKKLYGDLNDLKKLDNSNLNQNKITANNTNIQAPLTNRSNNNILQLNNNVRRQKNINLNNSSNSNRRPINNTNNINSSSNSNSSSDSNNNRYSLNENENLDSNNNKNSRNLNIFKNADLNPEQLLAAANSRLIGGSSAVNYEDEANINNLNTIFNEYKEYEEQLRQNQIENLDSILNEAKNRLSTTSDKDGYWCFKRKEGCKYLPHNGPIFKNDVLEVDDFLKPLSSGPQPPAHLLLSQSTDTNSSSTTITEEIVNNHSYQLQQQASSNKKQKRVELRKKDRLKELQQFYYGYAITKHNRHLGLVRRRLGRGGRILMDKYNENLISSKKSDSFINLNPNISLKKLNEKICPLNLTKFKTYYPIECFSLNASNGKVENENKYVTSKEQTNKPTYNEDITTTTAANNTMPKLKLKNFFNNETELEWNEVMADSEIDTNSQNTNILDGCDDELTFDHRLFSLYQFENDKLNEIIDNEFVFNNNIIANDGSSATNQSKSPTVLPKENSTSSSFVNLVHHHDDYNFSKINLDDDDFELFEYENELKSNYSKSNENDDNSKSGHQINHFNRHGEFKNNLVNSKIYDRTNLLRFDFSSASKLNDEYHSSSDECNLNVTNIKSAIKTLKMPPSKLTITNEVTTVDMPTTVKSEEVTSEKNEITAMDSKSSDESGSHEQHDKTNVKNNEKQNEEDDEKKNLLKLGESFANITSTTLTPPSPSPPLILPVQLNDLTSNHLLENSDNSNTQINNKISNSSLESKINTETNVEINSTSNATINSNNLSTNKPISNNSTVISPLSSPVLNSQNQPGRFIQSFNKIKNLSYTNDKIMQPLVNGTNSSNILPTSSLSSTSTLSTSTSSSSSPSSSSLSPQTYLVKKQQSKQQLINNTISKGSTLFYSSSPSSLPSSSSTSSSSTMTNSIPHIVLQSPSTKLANSSSNLVSITSANIQQTNQNSNTSNNINNTIVVNGVLTKKKDENNPFLLNNNTNFQNFHHIQQHQENQISSTTNPASNQFSTSINANSNNLSNGLIPSQKLFQAIQFSQNSTTLSTGIINSNNNNIMNVMSNSTHHNSLFSKASSNSNSIISSPIQVPIALTSSNSSISNTNNNSDLNNSTKLI